ncbi:magnesium transporter CorA family protein [Salsipaludibacter albus]|uniref:magnesium transporter CorA family protein n=1 Tax=Salsipaludibacter albus TaxID=2849650 RepID=UPI001EE4BE96|nr:magnesium transporter CorA family protein [Salsipaludibacter albus]MBY5162373.1 magnesium transporter CorA family protein [Salsipaludibacter albus]
MITIRHVTEDACTTATLDEVVAALEDDIPQAAGRAVPWYWVDVLDEADPDPLQDTLLSRLGVAPLFAEDMRDDRHLPKVELIDDQLLLVVHALRLREDDTVAPEPDPDGGADVRGASSVVTGELDVLLAPRLLVTWHRWRMPALDALATHLERRAGAFIPRPILLVHHLLDSITDVMVPFVDHFERRLDVVDADLLTTPTEATRDDLYRLQRDVIQLRRVVVPQAEVLRRTVREIEPLVDNVAIRDGDLPRFRDIYDHLYRMSALSESYSQLLDSALDTYRAAQDDELNDMLRVLTLVSAMLLPISVLAGIWGTNFFNLPGADDRWGFAIMMGSFALIIAVMGTWFRLRGWIGGQAERDATARRARLSDTLDVPVLGTILKVPVSGARSLGRGTRRLLRRR